jgi:reactive intermediate/imine deaminase
MMMKFFSTVIALMFTANAGAQDIERINPEGMTQPTSYSHLVRYDKLLFIAGQVAVDGGGNVVGEGDMAAQVRQVYRNLQTVLASAGADFSDVVKITIFTTDVDSFRESIAVHREHFGEQPPTSTLVQIERLARPVFLVEIEAIAISPD